MSFTFDPAKLNDTELDRFLSYMRKQKLTADARYPVALAEHVTRNGRGLTIEGTLKLIAEAARANRLLTYKEISDSVGRKWGQGAMAEINGHLGLICEWAINRRLPMLSAWVVPKTSLEAKDPALRGKLRGTALKGFLDCARSLRLQPGATEAEIDRFIDIHRGLVRSWAETYVPA